MPWRAAIAWLLVLPWTAWAVVRLLGLERGYPAVQLIAFTPYVAVVALFAGAGAALLRCHAPALLALVTAVALAAVVLPRALGGGDDAAAGGAGLRVLSANVAFGAVPPAELVALVRRERVDVLAVQELTPEFAAGLARAQLRQLLPHAVARPAPSAAGSAIYARTPLRALPVPEGMHFVLSGAEVAPRVRLLNVHAAAPANRALTRAWEADMRRLAGVRDDILAGDFNATLDHRAFRAVLDRGGYRDAADVAGAGLQPTWRGARVPPVTLDHVIVRRPIGVSDVSVHDLPGSDHRAVLAVLEL